jgi:hypothetical protein
MDIDKVMNFLHEATCQSKKKHNISCFFREGDIAKLWQTCKMLE